MRQVLRSETNVRSLPSLKKTIMAVEERWFRTNMEEALGFVIDCYVEQFLNDGHADLLEESAEKYET